MTPSLPERVSALMAFLKNLTHVDNDGRRVGQDMSWREIANTAKEAQPTVAEMLSLIATAHEALEKITQATKTIMQAQNQIGVADEVMDIVDSQHGDKLNGFGVQAVKAIEATAALAALHKQMGGE